MDVVIRPGSVTGEIMPPPSKSETHRGLFLAALAGGGPVERPLDSRDTRATAAVIDALGGGVDWQSDAAEVDGFPAGRPTPASEPVDCANSGTTLRLALGIAALAPGETKLTGDSSLTSRPNQPLLDSLEDLGGEVIEQGTDGTAPITISGPLDGGETAIDGSISSQFVSSLLIAGSFTEDGVTVRLTEPLHSAPYLDLTIDTLDTFGISVERGEDLFEVRGGQSPRFPADGYLVGADSSASSYPLAAGVIAGDPSVTVSDVGTRGGQPAPILEVLRSFGVEPAMEGRQVTVTKTEPSPATIDLGDCPDLLPTAAVIAAVADGTSNLINCEHARFKETDRIWATAEALRSVGVPVSEREDGLTVRGRPEGLLAGEIDSHGDHRLAMAGAIAGLVADGPVRVMQADCVDVSYPNFYEDLQAIGADIEFNP